RKAEQDARRKASENVVSLARTLRVTIDEELHRYLFLQNEWMTGLWLAANPTVTADFPDNKLKSDISKWEKDYPPFKIADIAAPQANVLSDGRWIEPPQIPLAPVPPKWFRELSQPQTDAWLALARAQTPQARTNALDAFQRTDSSVE